MRWKYLLTLVLAVCCHLYAQSSDWPLFRGSSNQTGVAQSQLPSNLKPIWTYELQGGVEATAAISSGSVYIGALDGTFVALDLNSGKERWKYSGGEEIKSSAAVNQNVVFFGDEKGTLHALNASSGEKKFTFQAEAAISAAPTFYQDHILVGSYDQNLYCLKPDGTVHWKIETEGYIHGTPATWNGNAMVAGCDGFLRTVQINDGLEKQKLKLGAYVGASPAIEKDRLFVGTFGNQFLAVDLTQSQVLWRYENPDAKFPFYSSPAIFSQTIFVGGRDKFLHALNAKSGKAVWKFNAKSRVDSSPVVSGNIVYFGTVGGQVYGLAADSGKVQWQYDAADAVVSSPAVADGKMVIATKAGTVYCFGPEGKS